MSPGWYYAQENKQFGPVSAAELKALADGGKLQPDDLVWREGMADWVPARRVKGLFEAEASNPLSPSTPGPAAADVSATAAEGSGSAPASVPVFTPPAVFPEAVGRGFEKSLTAFYRAREGVSVHIFDFLLDLLRRSFPASLLQAICQGFSFFGYYALYGAMGIWMVGIVVQTLERKAISLFGWGLAGLVALVVLQYIAGRFLPALERLNKSSPGRVCSTAFLDCIALLLLAIGVASVLGLVVYAVQQNEYLGILWAIELFIVMELAALMAVAPETLHITVSPETRAGEEALGVWSLLLKLVLKVSPVLFGLGVLQGTIELIYTLILFATQNGHDWSRIWIAFWHLALAAALPLLAYLGFLTGYLTIDLLRALLEIPALLQKQLSSTEQRTSEED
ncbi:MAG: DUF4339 domain-containing protein [Thermoguttaceae bacterium]|nr:DUF4339 domain-containing protein [Thermoguttaceae bacterium]MDW8038175.1 DUF4339 domain-containing protein [Thermoguttaceae bacterium]